MSSISLRARAEQAIGGELRSPALGGPIQTISRFQRALLMAELADIVYLTVDRIKLAGQALGLSECNFLDRDGAQACVFENADDFVVVCRGTEPTDWNDIKADVNVAAVIAETVGRVHRGFKREVDDIWPDLEPLLIDNNKRLWIAGHSLGGAMATIIASRCKLEHIESSPIEVHTFGSPRVGDDLYVNHTEIIHMRWVNNNDIVPRMPPRWLRYKHAGEEMYINTYGHIRLMTPWQRTKDRWRGFWTSLQSGTFDVLSDHLMTNYVEAIARLYWLRERR